MVVGLWYKGDYRVGDARGEKGYAERVFDKYRGGWVGLRDGGWVVDGKDHRL